MFRKLQYYLSSHWLPITQEEKSGNIIIPIVSSTLKSNDYIDYRGNIFGVISESWNKDHFLKGDKKAS